VDADYRQAFEQPMAGARVAATETRGGICNTRSPVERRDPNSARQANAAEREYARFIVWRACAADRRCIDDP
jgi:hypothetical protein